MIPDGGTYVPPVPEFHKLVDSGKAAFAYVYTTGHGNGKLAMQALYCAYDQNKFWEVHDLLMTNAGYNLQNNVIQNDVTKTQQLADFLASVVDKSFMKNCLDSGKYASRTTSDENFATSTFPVTGTPGFLINTQFYNGADNYTNMKAVIESALQ
jgi:protein-disulfide isomerase